MEDVSRGNLEVVYATSVLYVFIILDSIENNPHFISLRVVNEYTCSGVPNGHIPLVVLPFVLGLLLDAPW